MFREAGWARVVGAKNTPGVALANIALGGSVFFLSHRLYRKGGAWRKVAISVNFVQASLNTTGGVINIRRRSSSRREIDSELLEANAFSVSW